MNDTPLDEFLKRHHLCFVDRLGDGKDGEVVQTDRPSAAKHFRDAEVYRRELRMYRILYERNIDRSGPFQLPRFISCDDAALIVEITIVSPPFMLDFASSYDEAELVHLGFGDDVWEEREQHWAEIFGDDCGQPGPRVPADHRNNIGPRYSAMIGRSSEAPAMSLPEKQSSWSST